MRRYLVVANQTLGGLSLRDKITASVAEGPSAFHVVVPATKPSDQMVWTEGEAHEIARSRLEAELKWVRSLGAEATGEVGDSRPVLAIEDALIADRFDEIILSTLPLGMSRWLRQDLPARVRRHTGLPVTHVVGDPFPAATSA